MVGGARSRGGQAGEGFRFPYFFYLFMQEMLAIIMIITIITIIIIPNMITISF